MITDFFINQTWKKTQVFLLLQDFWGKPYFLKTALFHLEIVALTNSRSDIGVCIINLTISIKKYLSKLYRISFVQDHFLQSVKDHQYDIFGYVGKIMPCVFFKFDKNILVIKNPRTCVWAYLKYAGMHIFGFVLTDFKKIKL